MEDYIPPWEGYSSTMLGPCPVCRNMYYVNSKCVPCENAALRARVKVLEEAVEWAADIDEMRKYVEEEGFIACKWRNELRRRAGRG